MTSGSESLVTVLSGYILLTFMRVSQGFRPGIVSRGSVSHH